MNKYNNKGFDDDFEVIYDALDELDELDGYIDYDDEQDDSGYQKKDYENENDKDKKEKRSRSKRRKLPNLLSPAAKTVKAGGKAASGIMRTVLRTASLLLIAAIMALLAVNFWNHHSAYGDLASAVSEKNYALAAYLGFAMLLLLFELISFFWALSGQNIKDGRRIRKFDTGRGIFSFVIVYAGSYLSAHFGTLIPETPQALNGLKGAVFVYGSLEHTLFILCVAGVISCLARKFIFH